MRGKSVILIERIPKYVTAGRRKMGPKKKSPAIDDAFSISFFPLDPRDISVIWVRSPPTYVWESGIAAENPKLNYLHGKTEPIEPTEWSIEWLFDFDQSENQRGRNCLVWGQDIPFTCSYMNGSFFPNMYFVALTSCAKISIGQKLRKTMLRLSFSRISRTLG